jgi:hypothetical protein
LVHIILSNPNNLEPAFFEPYLRLAESLELKQADREWMLDVLFTLTNGEHLFFAKDFVA